MNVDTISQLVSRAIALTRLVPLVLTPVVIVLAWLLYDAHQTINQLAKTLPIYVVPGAMGGRYTAGLDDENIKNKALYWTGLLTNFTRQTAGQRLGELEQYADITGLAIYQRLKDRTLSEVETQSQSRTFVEVEKSAKLSRAEDGTYTYTVRGYRTFYSASIFMYEDQADVTFNFRLGTPSAKNPTGMAFISVDVRDVPGSKKQG